MSNIALRVRGYRLRLAGFLGLVLAFTVAVSTTAALSPSPSLVVPQGSVTPTDTPTAPCQSGIVQVNIQGLAFSPSNVTVCAGSQVKWTNADPFPHTSTSDTGVWDSGTLNNGESFTFRFDAPGVYPYHCAIYIPMQGTITVVAGPPAHSIYLPHIAKEH